MTDRDDAEFRARFAFRCGYCGVGEAETGSRLTVDHFVPRSRGGGDAPDNFVYCCHACNTFKGDYWVPDPPLRLLHPSTDDADDHWTEGEDGVLVPVTERGRNHIARLRLNRPQLVENRLRRAEGKARAARVRRLKALVAEQELEIERLNDELRRGRGG